MSISTYGIPAKHPEEDKRERAVLQSGALTLVQRQALTPVLNVVRDELGVAGSGITIIYQESAILVAATGFPVGVYDRATSFCAHAILNPDEPLIISDTRNDERFCGNPFVGEADGVLFYAAIALVDEDNLPLGTLWVFDAKPRDALNSGEIAFLRRVSQAVTALLRRHAGAGVAPHRAARG